MYIAGMGTQVTSSAYYWSCHMEAWNCVQTAVLLYNFIWSLHAGSLELSTACLSFLQQSSSALVYNFHLILPWKQMVIGKFMPEFNWAAPYLLQDFFSFSNKSRLVFANGANFITDLMKATHEEHTQFLLYLVWIHEEVSNLFFILQTCR